MAGSELASGSELAGYRIESLLGRGGMGVVYRAHDLALDRKIALKLLAPELAADIRFRERFLRESRLAASLDHPAIIPIYDAGEVAGQLYIAMRLVDGTDLKRLLAEKGVLEPERALALLEQVADALDAAHERGLVHRDVKPSNVLVDLRGHCYLADFGLSRRLADTPSGAGAGRSLGTVDYVAPEQIRGDQLDGRADLYSLGCLLYECLAGRPPFVRGSETAIVFAHLEEDPPALPGLEAVMQKALAKDPDDRYQSGRELIAAARDVLKTDKGKVRRALFATAVVLALSGAAIGGVLALRGQGSHVGSAVKQQSIALEPNAVNLIAATTRHVVARAGGGHHAHLSHAASDVAFLGRSAWLVVGEENRLVRVDQVSHKVTAVVKLPWTPTERIAAGGGLVWVREARFLGTEVLGIDGHTGEVMRRFPIGGSSSGVTYGADSLWLIGGARVLRVDPKTGRTLHSFGAPADWLAFGDGAVWAASTGGFVWKIDPVGNRIIARIRLHPWLSDLAIGGGFVWASIVGDDEVFKLSENDLSLQQVLPGGPDPERMSAGGGYLWVANTAAKTISYLALDSGSRRWAVTGSDPTTAAFHDGLIWADAAHGLPPLPPIKGLEVRISTPSKLMNIDPEQRVFPMDEQLSYATCANLLAYPDSAGADGNRLQPEIAASMPTLSPDRRTYVFNVRRGFRFSPPSNEPVTAATFKHTIERTLGPKAQRPWDYASDIVGANAFSSGRARHISGIRARGSSLSITLAEPAGDFLARLSLPVFCPVPRSTPLDPRRTTQPVASTGPYYIASVEPHRTILLRNPNYPGSRPRLAARIVFTDDTPTPKAVALVDSGKLDYLPPDLSGGLLAPGATLDRRYGEASAAARAGRERFYRHNRPLLDTIVFNTQRPLFKSAKLRRAVGYALDRPAMAKAYADAPAARLIPAAIPGYDAVSVYPLAAPALAIARRLAGHGHRRAVLLAPCDPTVVPAATILRSDLAKIGIAVEIEALGVCDRASVAAAFRHADLIIGTNVGRGPPDRDPVAFFDDALAHGGWQGSPLGPGLWYGAAFSKKLREAHGLTGGARVLAYTRLDDELARLAPLLVYGAFQYDEYFSGRIGCQLFQSFYKVVDLGALCLRKP